MPLNLPLGLLRLARQWVAGLRHRVTAAERRPKEFLKLERVRGWYVP